MTAAVTSPRHLSVMQGNTSFVKASISAGTESSTFNLPGLANFAVIGTTGTDARTLTLQVYNVADSVWLDTSLTATTSDTTGVLWTSTDLAPYAALAGHSVCRLTLSASDTVEVNFYGN